MSEQLEGISYGDLLGAFRGGPRGWNLRIYNLARTQAAMIRNARRLEASVGLKRAWSYLGPEMLEYARRVTHKWTGTLAASHRLDTKIGGDQLYGTLYIDPMARNPITGIRTAKYGPVEHERGGSHAFYAITFKHFKDRAGYRFMKHIYQDLEDK